MERPDGSDVERAYRAFKQAARDLEHAGALTAGQLRRQLRTVSEQVLGLLDEDEAVQGPDDVLSRLERQSRDIAEDLRRVDRLMRHVDDEE